MSAHVRRFATLSVAAGLTVLALLGTAPAQTLDAEVANSLRVEWQPGSRRSTIEGYVYNDSSYRIGGVRLRVESLDRSSQAPSETFGWVYGNIPGGGRWSFSMRLPQGGEVLRVTVESFHLVAREVRSESP